MRWSVRHKDAFSCQVWSHHLMHYTSLEIICSVILFVSNQTVTGDTIVSSKASAAAAVRRAQKEAESKSSSERDGSSLALAGVEVPEPVFFCSIEPPTLAKQAGKNIVHRSSADHFPNRLQQVEGLKSQWDLSNRSGACTQLPAKRRPQSES